MMQRYARAKETQLKNQMLLTICVILVCKLPENKEFMSKLFEK